MSRLVGVTRWLILFTCFITGVGLLLLFLPPYEQARQMANYLAADGGLEMFTQDVYQTARLPGLAAGSVLVLLACLFLLSKQWALRVMTGLFRLPGRIAVDAKTLFTDLRAVRLERWELALLLGLLALAVLARAPFLERPLEHDEAYTITVFASAPLREGLTDYHLPNNHFFHTLLAHFAFRLFGYQPWGVRLPAFLAGLLGIAALYFLARRLYGRMAALQAAALASAWPILVYYGTNARGYTLVMLLALLALLLALYVRERPGLVGWGLFALCAALGLYTIPLFLFPYAVAIAWLALTILLRDFGASYVSRWQVFRSLIFSGLGTALLTLLLYLPVVLRNGLNAVLVGDVTRPPGWGTYLEVFRSRMQDSWTQWMQEVPLVFGVLLVMGFVFSLLIDFLPSKQIRENRPRVPLQLAAVLGTLGVLFALRANGYPRFLIFLLPLALMWVSAGWTGLIHILQRFFRLPALPVRALTGLVLVGVMAWTGLRLATNPLAGFGKPGPVEQAVSYLGEQLEEMDLVVVNPPNDAVVWYYARLHGINMDHFKRELPFFRAYVLVDDSYSQTLDSVMQERGPELFFFDLSQAKVVYQAGGLSVYECVPNADLIRSEYHLP